ncbi:hypothetical protein MPH_02201 [Macrophomina phaseolina MS6]|uniref:Uncharacterized protein n=1 Tax=Macrophomina phaseolina (strain MS6) TaxID=1126212 RepID=K2S0K0_MACPH|nr:hypothetical protein MPH_02201 [Macrophomina phaseolina MS6]
MAHHGSVVTQSLTQIGQGGRRDNHPDAAQIARIWLNMPGKTEKLVELPMRAAGDEKTRTATERPGRPLAGPTTPAVDRRPAADHPGKQAAARRVADQTRHSKSSPVTVDPNAYYQLESPLFGKLPAELRVLIWEFALTPKADIDRPTVAVSLLESCRRAYDETKLMLYQQNQVRAHLLQSPLPGNKEHWTRLLSPAQQALTHLNLYIQPGASNSWGWNLLRWTKLADFRPATLQLTIWFTSSISWWNHYSKDILKSVSAMRGIKTCILEFRTERDRYSEFDKRIQELQEKEIKLADRSTLIWDGCPPEYLEGSRVMMTNAFGRPTSLPDKQQPCWVACQDLEKGGEGEMLAIILRWQVAPLSPGGPSS